MPTALTVPYGNLATFGAAKETNYGTFVAPDVFHIIESADPSFQFVTIPRTGAAGHRGQRRPIPAVFKGSFSFEPEPDGDTVGQLLAYAMGEQSTPTLTLLSETLSSATTIGATAFPVGSTAPLCVIPGSTITIDTSTAQEELTVANPPVTVSGGVYSINTTTGATKAHSSAASITLVSTTAYLSTLIFGQLPSFSGELNRVTETHDLLGCKMSSLDITLDKQKALAAKFAIMFQQPVKQTSPTTPTYSTKVPPIFNNPNAIAVFNGIPLVVGGTTLHSFSASLKNNLDETQFPLGSQYAADYPEKQRQVTGTFMLGFEQETFLDAFLADGLANVSQTFSILIPSTDLADSTNGVPYAVKLDFNNITTEQHNAPVKSTDLIYQTFKFTAAETAPQANDDMKITLVNTASAVY